MNWLEKFKLLSQVEGPAQETAGDLMQIKRGYKTLAFWITLLGSLSAVVASLNGLLSCNVAFAINTVLIVFYNILRGVQKTEETLLHPAWQSTEVWLGVMGNICNGIAALQPNANSQVLAVASALISAAMVLARDLAHLKTPAKNSSPIPAGH
jgi:hypothetical protein